jgi:RNA-directed DNA polymerase
MASISAFITRHLKLNVNVEKSAVGRPWERKFLGFRISADSPPLREIAPKSVARFKHRVRQITRRARGVSIDRVVKDLRPYLRGWSEYFGWCETPWLLRDLDKWVRHRLRCYLWVQWRTPRRRRARLGVLGVKPRLAAYISWSRGPWRPSGSKTLNFAIRNAYFDDLGLPRLYARRA